MEKPNSQNSRKQIRSSAKGSSRVYFGKQKGESLETFAKRVTAHLLNKDTPKNP